ncbi:MAG: hypothetical protein KF838_05485 [Phycisphaeraceae bacterium]|nr:MAG: hypothetical protein KF838_05485 [Phycisphaeraceae bacterium]
MRLATNKVLESSDAVEVAISWLSGDVGGMLCDSEPLTLPDRLPPTNEVALVDLIDPFDNDRFTGSLLHFTDAEQYTMVANIFEWGANQKWWERVSAVSAVASVIKGEVFAFAARFVAPEWAEAC